MACCRIVLMAVNTFDVYGLAVNEELTILDFDFAEADIVADGF